jgi:hypothetical protein
MGGDDLPRRDPTPLSEGLVLAVGSYDHLGVTPDLVDSVLLAAYKEHSTFSTMNETAAYVSDLEEIARQRDSDMIQIEIVKLKSTGQWSESDLDQAYSRIGLPRRAASSAYIALPEPRTVGDEDVSASFGGEIERATSADDKRTIKEALLLIARARASDFLQVIASTIEDVVESMTLDQAYNTLGATRETDGEFIVSLFSSSVCSSSSSSRTVILIQTMR